jgi:uncharacterized membrane protein HdeD (DUF308 family)
MVAAVGAFLLLAGYLTLVAAHNVAPQEKFIVGVMGYVLICLGLIGFVAGFA